VPSSKSPTFALREIHATAAVSFTVRYKGHSVGDYFADLLIEDVLVAELRCVERLSREHTAQCLNYLRASGRTICILISFQDPKLDAKRIVNRFPDSPPDPALRVYS
jgi:GxxExxY protein